MPDPKLALWAGAVDQANRPLAQKLGVFPCVSVRCPGSGGLPSTVLPAVQSWGPRNQASLNFRARRSRDRLKNGFPRVKTWAPDGNRHFPPGASGALEHSRGGAKASLAPLAGVRLRGQAKMAPTEKREGEGKEERWQPPA